MSLFTDGTAVTIDLLTQHDSGLLEVSLIEGINLTGKLSLAHDELAIDLHSLLDRSWTSQPFDICTRQMGVRNVVMSAPLRLWHMYQTLALVYRDCYFNQLNDRYQAKWREFSALAMWARNKVVEAGVHLAADPIAKAGPPSVTSVAASENGGTFYFSVSYVNGGSEEGEASAALSVTTADGNAADLQPANPPANATGWNVYAGSSPETMYLQNGSPLDMSSDFEFYPSSAVTSGVTPPGGQTGNLHRALPRLLQRG